jgi:hypothetical protein
MDVVFCAIQSNGMSQYSTALTCDIPKANPNRYEYMEASTETEYE